MTATARTHAGLRADPTFHSHTLADPAFDLTTQGGNEALLQRAKGGRRGWEVASQRCGRARPALRRGEVLPIGQNLQLSIRNLSRTGHTCLLPSHRYDRADTIGQNLPIYVQTSTGFVNATDSGAWEARVMLPVELLTPATAEELFAAQGEIEQASSSVAAFALSADSVLWAVALTGLQPSELECLEGNEGA